MTEDFPIEYTNQGQKKAKKPPKCSQQCKQASSDKENDSCGSDQFPVPKQMLLKSKEFMNSLGKTIFF